MIYLIIIALMYLYLSACIATDILIGSNVKHTRLNLSAILIEGPLIAIIWPVIALCAYVDSCDVYIEWDECEAVERSVDYKKQRWSSDI